MSVQADPQRTTSLPCATCGAALRPVEGRLTETQVQLACDWCGGSELLPADQAERALVIRVRAAERAWAEGAVLDPAIALMKNVEGDLARRYLSGLALLAFLALCTQLMRTEDFGAALESFHVWMTCGLLAGSWVGFLLVRRHIRAVLLPIVAAAPPSSEGAAARCRRCGAPLTFGARGFTACRFCKAENLASVAVVQARADALADESRQRRRAAQHTQQQVQRLSQHVGTTLLITGVLGAACFFGLGMLLGG